jgi:hypothetical protein
MEKIKNFFKIVIDIETMVCYYCLAGETKGA